MRCANEAVLGLMFSESLWSVALIWKNKPKWQKGLLNGIGGKVEDSDDSHVAAIVREFREETGFQTTEEQWTPFAMLLGDHGKWRVACYFTIGDLSKLRTTTDEEIGIFQISLLQAHPGQLVGGLLWQIAIALDKAQHGRPDFVMVTYRDKEGR